MRTPPRSRGRPDQSAQPSGRSGGPGQGRSGKGAASSQSGGRSAGSGRGEVRGARQEPGASRWSASGTSGNRGGSGKPRDGSSPARSRETDEGRGEQSSSGRPGTSGRPSSSGRPTGTAGTGGGRTGRDGSARAGSRKGNPARFARDHSSAAIGSGDQSGERGAAPREGSIGRGSWDRNRSHNDRSSGGNRPQGGAGQTASGNRSTGGAGGTARVGESFSARGRAEPRTTGSVPRTGRRGPQRSAPPTDTRTKDADAGPAIPDWARPDLLEDVVRDELSSLAAGNAAKVAGHLVATGELLDEDPQLALAHARAARASASRLACVREAVGVAAYHAGEFAEASRELRAYRRLSGRAEYLAVLADCERAAGRPDAALRLLAEAPRSHPGHSEWVEQQIVEAGARRDLGEISGAILVLRDALSAIRKSGGVDDDDLIRLRYAYADGLEAAGRTDEATAEFTAIAESDEAEGTDALLRAGLESEDADVDENIYVEAPDLAQEDT